MMTRRNFRKLLAILLALLLTAAVYGFAAANTVPPSYAGDGDNSVSGYTVSNVHYNLDPANPYLVSSVDFTLDASASSVYAAVGDSTMTWTWSNACTDTSSGAGTSWNCAFSTPPTVQSIYYLRVVATQ